MNIHYNEKEIGCFPLTLTEESREFAFFRSCGRFSGWNRGAAVCLLAPGGCRRLPHKTLSFFFAINPSFAKVVTQFFARPNQ